MRKHAAIAVTHLSKQYVLGGAEKADVSFREMVMGSLAAPFRRLQRLKGEREAEESFMALNDVNFEIMPGEVVGIIGRNGAGKSTLLKILSRITDPTAGRIEIRGRVSSLLEVGTGFHPELTGRENIYLNGAILGMTRREIQSKFDEIVAFAEVEKFLDTPVKRYSSGMYVRLAFAVAAHLEPEILVVDEVLAVGDAAFQKKCLGKMQDVGREGRTVLFVSHNMGAVRSLCSRVICLNQGEIELDDNVGIGIEHYMGGASSGMHVYKAKEHLSHPYIQRVEVRQGADAKADFRLDEPIELSIDIDACGMKMLELGVRINGVERGCVHHSSSSFSSAGSESVMSSLRCIIPAYGLAQGRYSVDLGLHKLNYQIYENMEHVVNFSVAYTGMLSDKVPASAWKGVTGPGFLQWD